MARKDDIDPLAAFALHYLEYLTSLGLLITVALILAPLYLFRERSNKKRTVPISGCRRAGLYKRSNLDDQFTTAPKNITPRVKALFVYPIKSCRGVELAASEVGSTGLKYDRLFTFAQKVKNNNGELEWRFITQREFPKLALLETQIWLPSAFDNGRRRSSLNALLGPQGRRSTIELESGSPLRGRKKGRKRVSSSSTPEPASNKLRPRDLEWVANGGCLLVRFGKPSLMEMLGFGLSSQEIRIPLEPARQRHEQMHYTHERMSIWKDCPSSINMTSEIPNDTLQKLRAFLGIQSEVALFRVDPEHERAVTRSLPRSQPDTRISVAFADAFPVNLLSLASVRELDHNLPNNATAKNKLCARRFRANIYLEGCPAFAEDEWTRIQVGRCLKPAKQQSEDLIPVGATTDDDSTAEDIVPRTQTMVVADAPYHVACRTARCKMPNVDPSTGVRDNNEPLTTLRKTRDVDPGASPHPCVGMQMIPLFSDGAIQVGEGIRVLEKGEHIYEKMFP
ncbi:hypothetical protein K431DRAFT_280601 [Polychaeton citri CBS 116435]|uniref:MOSC domain-containing protein n=1 Tax=Polychaeton citri CBS 116435 TaxID=1314669 RepID=A0A9P4QJ65_9PEZI|nr:hypothetical protein K431DRAFT_280601 [Polychaeton citri CBS 116435]